MEHKQQFGTDFTKTNEDKECFNDNFTKNTCVKMTLDGQDALLKLLKRVENIILLQLANERYKLYQLY